MPLYRVSKWCPSNGDISVCFFSEEGLWGGAGGGVGSVLTPRCCLMFYVRSSTSSTTPNTDSENTPTTSHTNSAKTKNFQFRRYVCKMVNNSLGEPIIAQTPTVSPWAMAQGNVALIDKKTRYHYRAMTFDINKISSYTRNRKTSSTRACSTKSRQLSTVPFRALPTQMSEQIVRLAHKMPHNSATEAESKPFVCPLTSWNMH